jgi:hypothetical protein
MCAIPGVTYNISTDLVPSWLFPQACVIIPEDVQTDLENDFITSVSLRARMTLSTDRLDVIKENPMVADQPTALSSLPLLTSANLCLACNPHLTRVNYRTLLQANNQHFSPVLSTKLSN